VVGAAAASSSSIAAQIQAGNASLPDRVGANGQSAEDGDSSGILLSPARYYDTLLDLSEKFFDGELDGNTFEESIRYMFGIEGYLVFTLDKVVGALIKAAQVIMTDSKCQELQSIMEGDKGQEYKDHIARRMKAESIVGKDENLYRIEWVPALSSVAADEEGGSEESRCNGTLLMQLLSRDDLTLDEDFEKGSALEKWLYYISTYTLWTPTEGLKTEAKGPFLDQSLMIRREVGDDAGTAYSIRNGLEIRVCISTYRLFYSQETEDYFARLLSKKSRDRVSRKMAALGRRRTSKFNHWLDSRERERQAQEGSSVDGDDQAGTVPVAAADVEDTIAT
jgi:paired amphipathic helix protein Sin3a